jgi:O-succinylbenzoic acid--CoA ligase
MSEAFITKVITPGIKGAETALEALRGLLFEGQSVALVSDESDGRFLHPLGLDSFDASVLYSDEPSLILLTGGTTAARKGVELPLSALKASAKASESVTGKNLLWVTALTPSSIAGSNTMIRSLLNGFEPVIFQGIGGAEAFLPNTFIPTLQEALRESQKQSAPLATSLVPTQIYRLLESPEALKLLSEFEVVLVGGAKLSTSSRNVLEDAGIRVIET